MLSSDKKNRHTYELKLKTWFISLLFNNKKAFYNRLTKDNEQLDSSKFWAL